MAEPPQIPVPAEIRLDSFQFSPNARPMKYPPPKQVSSVNTITVSDIGTVLDAMSYLSYVDVEPTFAETYLQNRYIRDEESVEMLNIITASKQYDPGFVFNWSSAITLPQNCVEQGGDKLASTIEKARKGIEAGIRKTVESAQDLMNESW